MMLLDEVMRYPKEEKLVGRVYEDNLGAIYLVKNQHVGARTKHIDVRAHFIRELEEAGYLKVQFVRSEENSADILNKNCPEKLHTKHAARIRNGNLECWREDVEDKRLLTSDSSSGNGTAMTVQYARPTVVRNLEDSFKNIYSGFVNGIRIPGGPTCKINWYDRKRKINGARNIINEDAWIEVKNKAKKVTSKKQDQFGKTKRSGRIDRSNLK
ncbi:gag-polypeptide of LTR copia-type [Fragilaria crotonensis]|nr:gag-polypeptide of LTR copia-type [Fragilaria crotonensis]